MRFRKIENSAHCIIACFILQNICIRENDLFENDGEEFEIDEAMEFDIELGIDNEDTNGGKEKRDQIKDMLA